MNFEVDNVLREFVEVRWVDYDNLVVQFPHYLAVYEKVRKKMKRLCYQDWFYQMCVHGALLVGSFAKMLCGEEIQANDYDLLVPLEKWQTIALLIPESAKPNKFGGWRFLVKGKDTDEIEVDVWPDTLVNYLTNCKTKVVRFVQLIL